MKSIKAIRNLKGKKVIVRVDFNVPINKGKILDDFRIKKAVPTISFLSKKGARVILIAHVGNEGTETLKPIAVRLKKYVKNAGFIGTPLVSEKTAKALEKMKNGDVVLLENLRQDKGEKANDPLFAKALASYADMYVNDAFSVSHRGHASVVGIPSYIPGFAGLQLQDEVKHLSKAFKPAHPFLFILGGAKFDTKIPLVKKFLAHADTVFIGGALMNDFFKDEGLKTGKSLVDAGDFHLANLMKHKNLMLPTDVEVFDGTRHRMTQISDIRKNEMTVDIGPETIKALGEKVAQAKFILWNGPLGRYEAGFAEATAKVLKLVAKSKAVSVVGGGDTVAEINTLKLEKKLSFVSTGGGATLDYLALGTLPGIDALT